MLIIGAGGHAKELLSILLSNPLYIDSIIMFFDNKNPNNKLLYNSYSILNKPEEVLSYFREVGTSFAIGIGGTHKRKFMSLLIEELGGVLQSIIAPTSRIGIYDMNLATGLNIMDFTIVSNSVSIGRGTLINSFSSIHHDVQIGEFCEISPRATILGNVKIGNFTAIGAGAVVLPRINIGNNVVVGAGSVVTKDIDDNVIVMGVPARIIRANS